MALIEDIGVKRADMLREGMKGEGAAGDDEWFEYFAPFAREGDDGRKFAEELLKLLPDNEHIEALTNALVRRDGMNLTQRREEYLKTSNIGYRTLMRREQEGVELMVRFMGLADEQLDRAKTLAEEEDEARDMDVRVLRERVARLEGIVNVLHDNLRQTFYALSRLANGRTIDAKDFSETYERFMNGEDAEGKDMSALVREMPNRYDIRLKVKTDEP